MKGKLAEDVFKNIEDKLEQGLSLTEDDLVPLTLCALMGGNLSQKERFHKAYNIVRNASDSIPNLNVIEAVLYTMATKFLTTDELNNLKEEIKMTELGTMIYKDGKQDGIRENATSTARNMFAIELAFEDVRRSIDSEVLDDAELKEIYDEVKASKKE